MVNAFGPKLGHKLVSTCIRLTWPYLKEIITIFLVVNSIDGNADYIENNINSSNYQMQVFKLQMNHASYFACSYSFIWTLIQKFDSKFVDLEKIFLMTYHTI